MARRRYISTGTSTDKAVNKLGTKHGDFAALLYVLMIPHAEDDATITGDPEELLATVLPMRRDKDEDDVTAALQAMHDLELIVWDKEQSIVFFPPESFYRYQTYIPPAKRRGCSADEATDTENETPSAQDSKNQRRTPQNAVSPSPSLSPSPTPRPSPRPTREEKPSHVLSATPASQSSENISAKWGRGEREKFINQALSEHPHWQTPLAQSVASTQPTDVPAYQAKVLRNWLDGDGTPQPPGKSSPPEKDRTEPAAPYHHEYPFDEEEIRRLGEAERRAEEEATARRIAARGKNGHVKPTIEETKRFVRTGGTALPAAAKDVIASTGQPPPLGLPSNRPQAAGGNA